MNASSIPEHFTRDLTIVMVGDFNPKIFQPAWFAQQELLRNSEAENADIEIVHSEVVSFSIDWLALQVTRDRFSITTKSEPYKTHLKDLVLGAFSKLSHTPVTQLGINYTETINFASETDWHNFGHFLAPKSPWKDIIASPGMMNLQIRGLRPDDKYSGNVNVTIAPAGPQIVNALVNDHYDLATSSAYPTLLAQGVAIIEERFDDSIRASGDIITKLLERFASQERFDNGAA